MSGWESNSFPKLKYMAKYLDKIKKLIESMLESKDMETLSRRAVVYGTSLWFPKRIYF